MGLMKSINIDCDYCGQWHELSVDKPAGLRWLRASLKSQGWRRRRDKEDGFLVDVCPECLEREAGGEKLKIAWLDGEAGPL